MCYSEPIGVRHLSQRNCENSRSIQLICYVCLNLYLHRGSELWGLVDDVLVFRLNRLLLVRLFIFLCQWSPCPTASDTQYA